jgi:transposase
MSKKKYRKFSKAFKREALQLVESGEKTMAEIERDLGISPGLLSKWRKRYQLNQDNQDLESSDLPAARREIRRLKRELEITQREREILKKVVSIFSQEEKE